MNYKIWSSVILIALVAVLATGCKKYADPPPIFEDNKDTIKTISRRVLVVGIDGFVGTEVKTIAPPKITELLAKSKYAWDAVSDVGTTDAASWKTLISGMSYTTHRVKDSIFISSPGGNVVNPEDIVVKSVPSLFNLILGSAKSDLRMAFATSWKTLLDRGAPEVERKMLGINDAAVKDSVVNILKNGNPELLFTHFNGPAIAGKQHGFTATADGYKNALLQIDTYIGEIMTALKARPQYNKGEQWLVIVTGTHGGVGTAYGGDNAAETNVFSMYYTEGFRPLEFTKEGVYYGARIYGKTTDANYTTAALDNGDNYNIGKGTQTVQLNIKSNSTTFIYPHFASKGVGWPQPNTPGWSMFQTGNGDWALSIMKIGGELMRKGSGTGVNVFDGKWHTISFAVYDSVVGGVNTRWVKMFSDNVRGTTEKIDNYDIDITNNLPVAFGWGMDKKYGAVDFNVGDIKIFNTALSDNEIRNNVCLTDITKHPKYTSLIGYWPCNEGFGGKFLNKASINGGGDFILDGNYKWDILSTYPCSYSGNINTGTKVTRLMKSVDLVTNVFYWLRVNTLSTWGLQGNAWLPLYDKEFLK